MQQITTSEKSGQVDVYTTLRLSPSEVRLTPCGIRLMTDWYLTIKQYVDAHNWAIMERTKRIGNNMIIKLNDDVSQVIPLVGGDIRPTKPSQLEWTLYKTVNLTLGKPIKINIPANRWNIITANNSTQFGIENEHYINHTSEYDNMISGCIAGEYTITPETPGEIKIMIGK